MLRAAAAGTAALALVIMSVPVGAQDVCAGASPLKKVAGAPAAAPAQAGRAAAAAGGVGVARGVNMYPGSGTGPIPDITDWKPRGRVAMGTELIVQGRNLVPGQLVAQLGNDQLTATTQSASEIRFKVPNAIDGVALVVFNKGGQPRTLETSYQVYDAEAEKLVTVTRVVPASFGPGDQVTVCGTNLFNLSLDDSYADNWSPSTTSFKAGKFFEVAGNFYANTPGQTLRVQALNVAVPPSGDRLTFTAGGTFVSGVNQYKVEFLFPTGTGAAFPTPGTASGTMQFHVKNFPMSNRVVGPTVTWSLGGPTVSTAYMNAFWGGQVHAPFTIIPPTNTNDIGGWSSQLAVQGRNLTNATWRIGNMPANGFATGFNGGPNDGTFALVSIPGNAPSGPICATLNGKTSCTPTSIPVLGTPTITRAPSGTVARFTDLVIEGINLLPNPAVPGLTYDTSFAWPTNSDGSDHNIPCNRVVKIVEHTANRIVFRIGDPAITVSPSARLPNGAPLFCWDSYPNGLPVTFRLWANYGGKGILLAGPVQFTVKQ